MKLNLIGIKLEEDIDFISFEEEDVFINNFDYLIEAIDFLLDLVEDVTSFHKSDYPKLYRFMEFRKAISFQED